MARKKQMSRTDLQAAIVRYQLEDKRLEGLETLPNHTAVASVNSEIQQAAAETGTNVTDIRLAEIKKYVSNLPDFCVELTRACEEWKSEHATYRNPENPDEYWYSPTGSGNPPKWIKEAVDCKPVSGHKKDMAEWMKKIERFRVETDQSSEAA